MSQGLSNINIFISYALNTLRKELYDLFDRISIHPQRYTVLRRDVRMTDRNFPRIFPLPKSKDLSYPKNGCSFHVYVLPGDKVDMYVHTTHFILNKSSDF